MLSQSELFSLALHQPDDVRPGQEAQCVVTTDTVFTPQVQSCIKLAISRKTNGQRTKVPLQQGSLSQDLHQFRLGFLLPEAGTYRVIVKLGDHHVNNSPLHFEVPGSKMEERIATSVVKVKQAAAEDVLQKIATMSVEAEEKLRSLSQQVRVSEVVPRTSPQSMEKKLVPAAASPAAIPAKNDLHPQDENCNPREAAVMLSSPESMSETIFQTPDQSLKEKGLEGQLEALLREHEVVKDIGLPLTLGLLEVEIQRIGQDKILQEKQELKKLPGKWEETKRLQREEQLVRGSQQVLGSKEEALHSLSMETSTVPPGQLQAPGGVMKPATALDLIRTPGSLGAARVLTVPQSREKDPARNPECSLNGPIGMCLLKNGCFVVASSFDDKVKMFSVSGKFIKLVKPTFEAGFQRPTDMVCLRSGEFVVRDDQKLWRFSPEGSFLSAIWQGEQRSSKSYGLAEDDEGRLVSITKSGRDTDLLFFNIEEGKLVKKMTLEDIVPDKANSKCRFLTFHGGNLYITDLGLNMVYVINAKTYNVIQRFGKSGSGPGCFSDPAGLGVDALGNMVVADSRNHRLCVFSPQGKFLGQPKLPEVRRPSGLVLSHDTRELFVLNLSGQHALVKYKLNI